jgi:hypothetical protein
MLSLHHSRPPASSAGALSPSSAPVLSGFAGEQNPVAAVSPHVAEKTIDETLIPEEEKAELVELVIGRNGNRIKAPIPPSMKSAINIRRLGPSGWELAKTTDFAGGMWLAFAEGEECRGYVSDVRPDKNGSFTIGVSTETALLPHVQLREDEILKDVPGVAIIQIKHNAPYASALLSAKRLSEKVQTALDLAFPSAFSNRERIAGLGNVDFIPQQTSKSQGKRRAHNDSDGREIAPGAPSPIVRFGEPIDVVPREDLTALHKCWESLKGKGSVTDDVFELVMEWRKYNENIYPALGQEDVYFFTPKETQFLARNPEPEFEAMHPDATPSKILEGITHPILAFPIKHINS